MRGATPLAVFRLRPVPETSPARGFFLRAPWYESRPEPLFARTESPALSNFRVAFAIIALSVAVNFTGMVNYIRAMQQQWVEDAKPPAREVWA